MASIGDKHTRERLIRGYAGYSKKKEAEIKTRANQVIIGCIYTGHHWGIESYHLLVDKDAKSATRAYMI